MALRQEWAPELKVTTPDTYSPPSIKSLPGKNWGDLTKQATQTHPSKVRVQPEVQRLDKKPLSSMHKDAAHGTNKMHADPAPQRSPRTLSPVNVAQLSAHKPIIYKDTPLLNDLKTIESYLIDGKGVDIKNHLRLSAVLNKYKIKLPVILNRPLFQSSKSDQMERLTTLKQVHDLAFAELGFWGQDKIWQTRKPLGKNSGTRQTFSKYQYSVAKDILNILNKKPDLTAPYTTPNKDKELRTLLLRAALIGLIKRPPFSLSEAKKADMLQEVEQIKTSVERYEHVNKIKSGALDQAGHSLGPIQRMARIFVSTRTQSETGALKESCKFLSDAKVIPPKVSMSSEAKYKVPASEGQWISSLGLTASLIGIVESGAGFIETIKKFRGVRKKHFFDMHMQQNFQDECKLHDTKTQYTGRTQESFDAFYSKYKLKKVNTSLNDRRNCISTPIEIYGDMVRYPASVVKDAMAAAVFGMRLNGAVSASLGTAVSIVTAPLSLLAMGISCVKMRKSTLDVQKIKAFQANLSSSYKTLKKSKKVSKQTLETFEGLLNNAKRGEPKATNLKFYKDSFSTFSYGMSSSIATWSTIGMFASAVSGPPGWVVIGAIATAAASGAVGYGIYRWGKNISERPKHKLQALHDVKAVIKKLPQKKDLSAEDLSILQKNLPKFRSLGILKKSIVGNSASLQEIAQKASLEKLEAYTAKYDASQSILKTIDMIRKGNLNSDVKTYLNNIGLKSDLINHIQHAPLTVLNIRKQVEMISNTLKVSANIQLSDCVAYVKKAI